MPAAQPVPCVPTDAAISDRVRATVLFSLKIRESQYNEDLSAGDVPEWDSFGHISLITAIEREFAINFDVNDSVDIVSVGDLLDAVRKYVGRA
jgi:acyl carrier protein